MDFVAWCGRVLDKLVAASDQSAEHELYGFMDTGISAAVFGELTYSSGFSDLPAWRALIDAVAALGSVGLLSTTDFRGSPCITPAARSFVTDPRDLWKSICNHGPERAQEAELLQAINRLSPRDAPEYSLIENLGRDDLLKELGWDDPNRLLLMGEILTRRGLAYCKLAGVSPNAEKLRAHATYRGLVWGTRRGHTM
jgi:hypothetical protein